MSIGLLMFVISCTLIGYQVEEACANAQTAYGGDCVDAMIQRLDDESQPFSTRNSAIWALGQQGDTRALPVLNKYYTGNIPECSSLENELSQILLSRAIRLIRGGFNLTAWAWR